MKTLLIATDFSANAKHAADYGYKLAEQLRANLVLCNAFIVPAEVPDAGLVTWPVYEYDELLKDSGRELEALRSNLKLENEDALFKPAIHCINDTGYVPSVINNIADKKHIAMTIMASHQGDVFNDLIIGDHSRRMIDETAIPLLLVPISAMIRPVKKIAFATDFTKPEKDLQKIYQLINLVRPLNAELLIAHIEDLKQQTPEFKKWLDGFLVDLSNKANYPNIYYRLVKSNSTERGLEWLSEHGQVDILAMVHREHGLFGKIFKGSHTQKMARRLDIPLLIIPQND